MRTKLGHSIMLRDTCVPTGHICEAEKT